MTRSRILSTQVASQSLHAVRSGSGERLCTNASPLIRSATVTSNGEPVDRIHASFRSIEKRTSGASKRDSGIAERPAYCRIRISGSPSSVIKRRPAPPTRFMPSSLLGVLKSYVPALVALRSPKISTYQREAAAKTARSSGKKSRGVGK